MLNIAGHSTVLNERVLVKSIHTNFPRGNAKLGEDFKVCSVWAVELQVNFHVESLLQYVRD